MKKAVLLLVLSIQFVAHAQWATYDLPKDFPVYNVFTDLIYTSKNTIWARYSTSNTPTYKSNDGGIHFGVVNKSAFNQFRPLNDTIVFALNWYGEFVKSVDGGVVFSKYSIVNAQGDTGFKLLPISDMYFYNERVGWVLGDDTTSGCKEIWRTENGGDLWEKVPCEQIDIPNKPLGYNNFYQKNFVQSKLFLLDTKLRLNRSGLIVAESMGKSWIQREIIPELNTRASSFTFIDSLIGVIAVNLEDTTFTITKDGGMSWQYLRVPNFASGKILYAKPTTNKRGYLLSIGSSGAFISYDTAKTWIMIDDYWHSNASFYDAETGISMTQPTSQRNGAIRVFNGYLPDPVGIKENIEQPLSLNVFPNPAQQVIYLNTSDVFGVSQIHIFDITGKDVQYLITANSQTEIPVAHLNNGMYFLRLVSNEGKVYQSKFCVQK